MDLSAPVVVVLVIVGIIGAVGFGRFWQASRELQRAEFIREYQWPAGLLAKLEKTYPGFGRKESALVGSGLRQFFLAHLKSGRRYVSMPSQSADELWHEFILYTRDYNRFCDRAFGQFLHHTPAVVLTPDRKSSNEGLRRIWWQCCKLENIDPVRPSRLPLLFALDTKLKIPNGYVYAPDCKSLRDAGVYGGHCGGDFSSSSVDGDTSGFGDNSSSSGDGSGDSGGDSGSDGGGGCGGGGGD